MTSMETDALTTLLGSPTVLALAHNRVKKILISNEWGSVTYFYHIYSILSSSSSQITVTGRIIIQVYLYITIV